MKIKKNNINDLHALGAYWLCLIFVVIVSWIMESSWMRMRILYFNSFHIFCMILFLLLSILGSFNNPLTWLIISDIWTFTYVYFIFVIINLRVYSLYLYVNCLL